MVREFAKTLLYSRIECPVRKYVERKNYVGLIDNIYSSDGYTVVLGPKGTGKTTLIEHTLSGVDGVVRVFVKNLKINIYTQILMAMGIPYNRAFRVNDAITFAKLVRESHKYADPLHICNTFYGYLWRPCIVVELDDFVPAQTADDVAFALRCLTISGKCCAVLILEDSTALHVDVRTDNLVWVDNFTKDEAFALVGTHLLGTHPAKLGHFLEVGCSVQEYTDKLKRRGLLNVFNFQTDTQQLIDTPVVPVPPPITRSKCAVC